MKTDLQAELRRRVTTVTESDWGLPLPSLSSDKAWGQNLRAHPLRGTPGLLHSNCLVPMGHNGYEQYVFVQVSLLYADDGALVGCLRHYPAGFQSMSSGECSIVIDARQRNRGYALRLLKAADEKWSLNFWCQQYTAEGRALVIKYLNQRASE
jgi:hypothetical protein